MKGINQKGKMLETWTWHRCKRIKVQCETVKK